VPHFSIAPAYVSNVRVAGVSCSRARVLLGQTTLSRVRRGRETWLFGGFSWWFASEDESSATIVGHGDVSGFRLIDTAGSEIAIVTYAVLRVSMGDNVHVPDWGGPSRCSMLGSDLAQRLTRASHSIAKGFMPLLEPVRLAPQSVGFLAKPRHSCGRNRDLL
jgi:hypothetical protein